MGESHIELQFWNDGALARLMLNLEVEMRQMFRMLCACLAQRFVDLTGRLPNRPICLDFLINMVAGFLRCIGHNVFYSRLA